MTLPHNEPRKFAVVVPVLQEVWDNEDQEAVIEEAKYGAIQLIRSKGELVSDIESSVAEKATIDGLYLPSYDDEGNELPLVALIRFSAYIIPNEQSLKEINGLS